ncbi:XRE family transcriptional regulator [Sphaerisporangium sp. NPDC051017]|uniref:XRE family transcriptional regulator n=1 Tax=Sphaerisporangium sp. NPDC051017 TaxID=3154636 RepID=UPI003429A370
MANERLRAALLERGVSIGDLAVATSVDPKTVERWITQARRPYRKHRYVIATFLQVDEAYLWPDALTPEQVTAAGESEIVHVYPHRWAVPRDIWGRLFTESQREIGILVYSGMFLADDPGMVKLLGDKAAGGVRVRILLGDPHSPQVAQRGADEGIGEAMAAKTRNALVLYRPIRDIAGVEIRLHGTILYNSIYRADDQVLVNPHVYGQPAANAPVLHLKKVIGGDMVATYAAGFERVWEQAIPVES